MNLNVKEWCSTIPPISTKLTISSHPISLNTRIRWRRKALEIRVLAWDRHTNATDLSWKHGIPIVSLLVIGYQTAVHILTNDTKRPAHIHFDSQVSTLSIFYCSILNNWIGQKFHTLETSSPSQWVSDCCLTPNEQFTFDEIKIASTL